MHDPNVHGPFRHQAAWTPWEAFSPGASQAGGCGHEFCWLCLGEWSTHGTSTGGQLGKPPGLTPDRAILPLGATDLVSCPVGVSNFPTIFCMLGSFLTALGIGPHAMLQMHVCHCAIHMKVDYNYRTAPYVFSGESRYSQLTLGHGIVVGTVWLCPACDVGLSTSQVSGSGPRAVTHEVQTRECRSSSMSDTRFLGSCPGCLYPTILHARLIAEINEPRRQKTWTQCRRHFFWAFGAAATLSSGI